MLNMVNTTAIEEIELFVEVVRIPRQAVDYGCGPSSDPILDTGVYGDDDACAYEEGNDESDEDVDDEYDDDLHVQADGHVSSFQTTNQVLKNKQGILSLRMHYLVMYRISQMMRDLMSQPLFSFTYHQPLF